MHYTSQIRKSNYSFREILKLATDWYDTLSEREKGNLKEELKHGTGHLTTVSQIKAYISAYGEMHEAKLRQAYGHISSDVWSDGCISVVDYGCGVGIAEMVLSDYLTEIWVDNSHIKDFTLIEPSRVCLNQCVKYVDAFYIDANIRPVIKTESQLIEDDISPESKTVIHILSNVIDMEGFQGARIADILSRDNTHNNIVLCVSPYYQENGRGKKMEEFGRLLHGYSLRYKFEKHTDEWNKPYSCQIHIYERSYF